MSRRRHPRGFAAATLLAFAALAAGLPGAAGSARSDQITITMLGFTSAEPAWQVLIPNFERVYPNITINATYVPGGTAATARADRACWRVTRRICSLSSRAASAPNTMCTLAQAGELAPLVNVPWAKRSLPSVTSLSKYGKGLYVFEPQVAPYGVFTNNTLFAKLGLKVPQTFAQLLDVCRKAKAAGTLR